MAGSRAERPVIIAVTSMLLSAPMALAAGGAGAALDQNSCDREAPRVCGDFDADGCYSRADRDAFHNCRIYSDPSITAPSSPRFVESCAAPGSTNPAFPLLIFENCDVNFDGDCDYLDFGLIEAEVATNGVAALTCPAHDPVYPLISPEFEATDPNERHLTSGSPVFSNSNMVRIGTDLHVIYRVRHSRSDPEFLDDSAASGIAGNFDMGVYVRTFDLASKTFRPAVRVLRRAIYHRPTGSRLSAFSVHHEPSVFRDGTGNLRPMAFADAELRRDRFAGTDTFPPLQTSISDLDDPRSWAEETGLAASCRFDSATLQYSCSGRAIRNASDVGYDTGATMHDLSGVYDDQSKITHVVAEGGHFAVPPRVTPRGIGRLYFRLNPDASYDGPYYLVRARNHFPAASDSGGGNIFTKGDIVLGKKVVNGHRTLHLVWSIRNTFRHRAFPALPLDGGRGGSNPMIYVQHNYDLYYATSEDGGNTWMNAPRTASVGLETGIEWNDPNFLMYEGDIAQGSERAMMIDENDQPIFVVRMYVSGGLVTFGHVNARHAPIATGLAGYEPARYALVCLRYDGSSYWDGSVIDTAENWGSGKDVKARYDRHGGIWVFNDSRFNHSADGRTWSGWQVLDTADPSSQLQGAQSYADPEDPAFHYITYTNRRTGKLFFRRLRLTW